MECAAQRIWGMNWAVQRVEVLTEQHETVHEVLKQHQAELQHIDVKLASAHAALTEQAERAVSRFGEVWTASTPQRHSDPIWHCEYKQVAA